MTIQVFVSYRRGDSPHAAGRLVDRLDKHFKLFIDVDRIRPGADFASVVREAVDKSDVLVAVIGSEWLTVTAENGGRRIDQPGDWVAEEVGTALLRGTLVIPVLIDGAQMPSRNKLPPALADLADRQALRIAHESFAADCRHLIETIEEMVSAATPQTVNLWHDPDYPQARGDFLQGLWPAAIEGFERVLHRHPRQQHVVEQLEQARRSQHLLDLDATAKSAAAAGRWQEVVDTLKAIDALQPSDEVKDRLTQAQLSLRINELHNDVRALASRGNWKAVLAAEAELARLDAGAADPDGLATRARAELLEADLAASYARAVQQVDHRDWAGAPRRKGKPEKVEPQKPAPPSRLIVIVALAAIVLGALAGIMLLDRERPSSSGTPSHPSSATIASPGTPSHPSSATTASPGRTGGALLLFDDFHTKAHGWKGQKGRYVDDMYRIDLEPYTNTTSSPRNASSVYPSAPSDLRIEVEARSLDPLDDRSSFGVICYLNIYTDDRYQFTIGEGENTVRITKFLGGRAEFLAIESVASLNTTDVNKIRADCTNVKDAVRLVFRLNGRIVADVTDSTQPLPDGTVGIRAFARQSGIRTEFDNFVVTPL